jgi:uncharacterized protein YabN with tetrapyrrole methylase and pyrophosphatase domain
MMNILNKLVALEKEAADFGFKWETADQILAQIQSEVSEIDVHVKDGDRKKLQEEIGDLMHAVFSLCVFCQFDAGETLASSVNKFERRFRLVQQLAGKKGLQTLAGMRFDELMALWGEAKDRAG